MEKDTAINFFIFLLSGTSINGRQEEFYAKFIKPEWHEKILAQLLNHGLVNEIEYFFKVTNQEISLNFEEVHTLVRVNREKKLFNQALKAATYHSGAGTKKASFDSTLQQALEFYLTNPNDEKIDAAVHNVVATYLKHYPIIK